MRIRLPKDITELRIIHLQELSKLSKSEEPDVEDMVEVIALLSGTPKQDLLEADIRDIQKAHRHCLMVLGSYVPKEPQKSVKVKGKKYNFIPISKQKGGWYIDAKVNGSSLIEEPELIPAFMYVEEGMKYSQKDKEGHVLNPLRDRARIFRDHFPADLYLDLNAFFLTKSETLTKGFSILSHERMMEMTQEVLNDLS